MSFELVVQIASTTLLLQLLILTFAPLPQGETPSFSEYCDYCCQGDSEWKNSWTVITLKTPCVCNGTVLFTATQLANQTTPTLPKNSSLYLPYTIRG